MYICMLIWTEYTYVTYMMSVWYQIHNMLLYTHNVRLILLYDMKHVTLHVQLTFYMYSVCMYIYIYVSRGISYTYIVVCKYKASSTCSTCIHRSAQKQWLLKYQSLGWTGKIPQPWGLLLDCWLHDHTVYVYTLW